MVNEQIQKTAKYICALNPTIDAASYKEQLNILYGAVYEISRDGEDYTNELIAIEEDRIKMHGTSISKRITNPIMLITEYSQIAFSLAQKSYTNNEKFAVAPLLNIIADQLFSSELIGEKEKKNLRSLVSETALDFGFAAGNHNISSIRMAPIIRKS